MTIQSFKCSDTKSLQNGVRVRRWVDIERVALRKLEQLNIAGVLGDLKVPPGNKLEALAGDRIGQHSIRVNDQWRICFVWDKEAPKDVEIAHYQ
jgi:toxin HigB-1